jgi:hypothetical protein
VLNVRLARASGVFARRGLALSVSCQRGCQILATATLEPVGHRGSVALVGASRALPRNFAGHVHLRLSGRALARLRAALGRRRLLSARVRVVAAGPTGRRTTVTRVFTVSR